MHFYCTFNNFVQCTSLLIHSHIHPSKNCKYGFKHHSFLCSFRESKTCLVSDVNNNDVWISMCVGESETDRERQIEKVIRAQQASSQQTTQLKIPTVWLPSLSAGTTSHLIGMSVLVVYLSVHVWMLSPIHNRKSYKGREREQALQGAWQLSHTHTNTVPLQHIKVHIYWCVL